MKVTQLNRDLKAIFFLVLSRNDCNAHEIQKVRNFIIETLFLHYIIEL